MQPTLWILLFILTSCLIVLLRNRYYIKMDSLVRDEDRLKLYLRYHPWKKLSKHKD